jgi:hypothetical protein
VFRSTHAAVVIVIFLASSCGGGPAAVVTSEIPTATREVASDGVCGCPYLNPGLLLRGHWPTDSAAPVAGGFGAIWEVAFIAYGRVEASLLTGEYEGIVEVVAGGGPAFLDFGIGTALELWDAGRVNIDSGLLLYAGIVAPIPGLSSVSVRHTWYLGGTEVDGEDVSLDGFSVSVSLHWVF